ncbi:MAG: PDZ domain-containing protein, partial [Planctomycetota bacterium]|nr:PDZ domain-containing protein [Planctomycetota bacterium]
MNRIPLLTCLALCAWAALAVDEAPAPKDPPPARPDSAALIAKLEALEKRIQSLEQAMVEKDARIVELQKKLAEQQAVPLPPPEAPQGMGGFQFNLTPEQMRDLNRRLDDFFKDNLDGPFGEEPPGAARDMDEELDQMMREFARERRAVPGPQPRPRGPAQKPRLGVYMEEVSAQLNTLHGNKAEEGAFITRVVPETPAEKAGLAAGDCVQSFNGRKVRNTRELTAMIAQAPEGKSKL